MSAASQGGTNWDIINLSITGSDTELTYSQTIKSFVFWSRGDKIIQWRKTSGATSFATFRPGEKPNSNVLLGNAAASSASLGFIRTQDGSSDTIEGVVTY